MQHATGHPAGHPLAEALDLGNTVLQLESITAARLASVPVSAIAELIDLLDSIGGRIKTAQAEVSKTLTARYAEQAKLQLLASGRDTGVTHLTDAGFDITAEIGKDVKWEQPALKQLARRIAEGGEDPAEYIEVRYSVSEAKYKAWPETIRSVFESARTVTPKAPKFSLKQVGEGK
jgi:hypothetical protein